MGASLRHFKNRIIEQKFLFWENLSVDIVEKRLMKQVWDKEVLNVCF